jgi:hypothetical protein
MELMKILEVHLCSKESHIPELTLRLVLSERQYPLNTGKRKDHLKEEDFQVVREGVGAGERNDPSIVCTYE